VPLWPISRFPSTSFNLLDLHSITQPITHRQDFRAQLRMIDEVLIEFAQRFRRCFLIRRANFASSRTYKPGGDTNDDNDAQGMVEGKKQVITMGG